MEPSKKVKLHGVAQKSGRGLPSSIIQDEVQNCAEQDKVRGTVLAAELRGDDACPSLLAVSVYDTKPVHFLTMCAKKFAGMRIKEGYLIDRVGK